MSAFVIAPVLIPAFAAPILILLRKRTDLQRAVSMLSVLLLLAAAIQAYALASDGTVRPYLVGDWPAPFGIILVLDRLSATMSVLTASLAAAVALHVAGGRWDERGPHFHPLFHFQLMGVNGAFLTGDVFNLFVFFEVLLIASYGLLLHGGGAERLAAGFRYVAINLVGSTLFLFAVGVIYSVTGSLNMADLARKAAAVAESDGALLRTGALLLFLVFALKAGLVPVHWWLPGAYRAASGPVAALFMIMTKVGAYSIIRVHTLIFGDAGGPAAGVVEPWLFPAATVTLLVGAAGVLGARNAGTLVSFAVVWSMGSLLAAIGLAGGAGLGAALYYMLHSTVAGAALFLICDVLRGGKREGDDALTPTGIASRAATGALFFGAAVAMAGLPPLSGFVGKLMILDASLKAGVASILWPILLASSLFVIVAFGRAGSTLFWRPPAADAPRDPVHPRDRAPLLPAAALVAATVLLSVFAGPVAAELDKAAVQLRSPDDYVRSVFGEALAGLGAPAERIMR